MGVAVQAVTPSVTVTFNTAPRSRWQLHPEGRLKRMRILAYKAESSCYTAD